MEGVLEEVLKRVKPGKEEEKRVKEVWREVKGKIIECGGGFREVMLVGSVAKDTYLAGTHDLDVFLLYPEEFPFERFREEVERIGECFGGYELRYAQHPYVKVKWRGYDVDVVPAYDTERPKSAVDRTPHHVRFVLENLKEEQRDEVRLLKAFMRGIGTYGAEINVRGFSGYLCELLVIKYGSFLKTLENAGTWGRKTVLWIGERGHKKFRAPLVFYDPVDLDRNVAAAVSEKNKATFVLASRLFLYRPSLSFFFPERRRGEWEVVKEVFLNRETFTVTLLMGYPEGVSLDVFWGELEAFARKLEKELEREGFKVLHSGVWTDEKRAVVVYEFEQRRVPRYVVRRGPPVYEREHADRFLSEHAGALFGPWVGEDGRLYVEVRRRWTRPEDYIAWYISRGVEQGTFRKELGNALREVRILPGRAVRMGGEFLEFLVDFLIKRPEWMEEYLRGIVRTPPLPSSVSSTTGRSGEGQGEEGGGKG